MRHLPDPHRCSISDDPRALLLMQLHSDAPTRESLALLPPVLLFALLPTCPYARRMGCVLRGSGPVEQRSRQTYANSAPRCRC